MQIRVASSKSNCKCKIVMMFNVSRVSACPFVSPSVRMIPFERSYVFLLPSVIFIGLQKKSEFVNDKSYFNIEQ